MSSWQFDEDVESATVKLHKALDTRMTQIKTETHRTGLVYDERMTRHYCTWNDDYTEKPARLEATYKRCQELGLLERCHRIKARFADKSEMTLLHDEELIEKLKSTSAMSEEEMKQMASKYDYIYFHSTVYENASLALGSSIELVDQILSKQVRNGMALVRPPGHHAMKSKFCGYCYLNNVATAARFALDNYGLERVLIVDWDVHHGQGTQYMFYDDPRVLFFSIHRFEEGKEWPNLDESQYTYIGQGKGKGYNINVPLNVKGCEDRDYMAIILQILLPIAFQFNPQLVLISAGYDAALGCPEGEMQVSPALFAHVVSLLSSLAEGQLCLILEGGYCVQSLAEGVALSIGALLGDPCPPIGPIKQPCDSVRESILNSIKVLRLFWSCLAYQGRELENNSAEYPSLLEWPESGRLDRGSWEKYSLDDPTYDKNQENVIQGYVERLLAIIENTVRRQTGHRVCLAYSEDLFKHQHMTDSGYPECPSRVAVIYNQLKTWGLLDRCQLIQGRRATDEELLLAHSESHVNFMKKLSTMDEEALSKYMHTFNSVFFCGESNSVASLAVGSLLSVVDNVMEDKSTSGVAVIRPPGHHAEENFPMGFCIYNNVAIAAEYAMSKFKVQRVLILDWDVHHGNGIQHMFYNNNKVLYVSIHRYDDGIFFPSGSGGNNFQTGKGPGLGYNINIAWDRGKRMGDNEYLAVFQQIVLPVAYEFSPELVLVSAGFDASVDDYLGGYDVSPQCYAVMTKLLMGLANSRIILALEGGYNLEATSMSLALCTSVLLGDPCPELSTQGNAVNDRAVSTINKVLDIQKDYWTSLRFRVELPDEEYINAVSGGQFQDVIDRLAQTAKEKTDDNTKDYTDESRPKEVEHSWLSDDTDVESSFVGEDRGQETSS